MTPPPVTAEPPTLKSRWQAAWPEALARWSRFTQLREPLFLAQDGEAQPYGLAGEIAAIRLVDQAVMVNLGQVAARGLGDMALPILAHEIGHHIYVPANLTENGRLLAVVRKSLDGLRPETHMLAANLYADLLINDRLQRRHGVEMTGVYARLKERSPPGLTSRAWKVYTRAYDHLWRLKPGTLSPEDVSDEMNQDAVLIARIIRNYGGEWLSGARRFATVLFPYLRDDEKDGRPQTFTLHGLDDTKGAGRQAGKDSDAVPDGLSSIDPAELGDDGFDEGLEDELGGAEGTDRKGRRRRRWTRPQPPQAEPEGTGRGSKGQFREPFQYGELLRALGLDLSEHEITTRYYRERALPHLIPFPSKKAPRATEPLAEGYATWEPGEPLEDLDLLGSILQSPHVIPGVTTVQRVYGQTPGSDPQKVPLDLDLYVDCSGSMPNPGYNISYLALAGTILALSALRAGARVQATLWSGAGQFDTTGGFARDEKRILGIITGYLGDGTAFPLHFLRDTYAQRKPTDPPVHIVVISDNGVDTMFQNDERGTPGERIAAAALSAARGGGTLALNLFGKWAPQARFEKLGFKVHTVQEWEDLVRFAREFVRENYGDS